MASHARRIRPHISRPFTLGGVFASLGLLAALLPLACSQGCNPNEYRGVVPPGTPTVRVLVRENVPQATLSATEPPTVRSGATARTINLSHGSSVILSLAPGGWKIR